MEIIVVEGNEGPGKRTPTRQAIVDSTSECRIVDVYGRGFLVEMSLAPAREATDAAVAFVQNRFPRATLAERFGGLVKLHVPVGDADLATVFAVLEELKASDFGRDELGLKFFTVSQQSLEQIFMRIARDADGDEGEEPSIRT